ncbi:MAG: hypothetical protein A2Y64_06555 [Candidatus Coatesbacteria bacterium RBG_13_66_14]|uniref:DUF4878 domain-containing protein n=1 Tax=Candidatus Coatesbacteria bacterium RBG_13_66_14 TaxID=1817816 RepID=A0A1F5F6Q3_9BACT|nr:MAG: hypothetical protein A2Y64_06555 [Candidatus Coatesbacteria bacterium RBG_13_66_14]
MDRSRIFAAGAYLALVVLLGCADGDGESVTDGTQNATVALPDVSPGEVYMAYVRSVRRGEFDRLASYYSKEALAELDRLAVEMNREAPELKLSAEKMIVDAARQAETGFADEVEIVSEVVDAERGTAEVSWRTAETPAGCEGFVFFVIEDGAWKIGLESPAPVENEDKAPVLPSGSGATGSVQ